MLLSFFNYYRVESVKFIRKIINSATFLKGQRKKKERKCMTL